MPDAGLGHSTVLNTPDVRIIVLAFAAGHILKQHAAPFTLLMQALDGHLLVTSDGQELDLRPGGLIRMDPRLPHSVQAYVDSRLMLDAHPELAGQGVPQQRDQRFELHARCRDDVLVRSVECARGQVRPCCR